MQPRDLSFESLFGPRYGGAAIPDSRARQLANQTRDQNEKDFQGAVELDGLASRSLVVAKALQEFEALGLGRPALAIYRTTPQARLVFPDARINDPLQPVARPGVSPPARRFVAPVLQPAKTFLDHPEMAVEKVKNVQALLSEDELLRYFDEIAGGERAVLIDFDEKA